MRAVVFLMATPFVLPLLLAAGVGITAVVLSTTVLSRLAARSHDD